MAALPPTLRCRRDFLAASQGQRWHAPGFVLLARQRMPGEAEGIRIGYTCSKKLGNAVTRNRAKRRLRAVAADVIGQTGRAGWDYVLIGRAGVTVTRSYADLTDDLASAVERVHARATKPSHARARKPSKPHPGPGAS